MFTLLVVCISMSDSRVHGKLSGYRGTRGRGRGRGSAKQHEDTKVSTPYIGLAN